MTRLLPAALAVLTALTGCEQPEPHPQGKGKKLAEGGWELRLKQAQAEGQCQGMDAEISHTTLEMWLNRKDNGQLVLDVEGLALRGEQDGSSLYAEFIPPQGGGPVPVEDDVAPPPCEEPEEDTDADYSEGSDEGHGEEDRDERCHPGGEEPPPPPPEEEIYVTLEGDVGSARRFTGSLDVLFAAPGRDCELHIPFEAEFVGGDRPEDEPPVAEPLPAEPGHPGEDEGEDEAEPL